MTEFPIHCCCEPGKRLGYLRVERCGRSVTFQLENTTDMSLQRVELRFRPLHLEGVGVIVALDNGHQPIEVLQKLPGFRKLENDLNDELVDSVYNRAVKKQQHDGPNISVQTDRGHIVISKMEWKVNGTEAQRKALIRVRLHSLGFDIT